MERTIKVRTFLGQAIDTFKEYIKTKGNLQIDYSLEEYMQEILDYIDYLEKENQELKKKYENAVADYETTMFEKEQLNSLVNSCQEEIRLLKKQLHEASLTIQEMTERDIECPSNCEKLRRLKKQLEDKTEDYKRMKDNFDSKVDVITEIDTQQKEFIKYLEEEIKTLEKDILETIDDMDKYMKEVKSLIIEEILQKYKEIIGDDK